MSCNSFPSSHKINNSLCTCHVWSRKTLNHRIFWVGGDPKGSLSPLLLLWINQNHPEYQKWWIQSIQLIHQQHDDIVLMEPLFSQGWLHGWLFFFLILIFQFYFFPEVSCMSVPFLLCSVVWTFLAAAQLQCDPFWWKTEKSWRKSGDINRKLKNVKTPWPV